MFRIRNHILILILAIPIITSSQTQKETVFLLFDTYNKEKCKVAVEGKGYLNLSKYRKVNEPASNLLFFKICEESFAFDTSKKKVDTISTKVLNNLKLVDLEYINQRKSESILKQNPFEKIYLLEKISDDKILRYNVTWINNWVMVE